MIEVKVLVDESRIAEFYEMYGRWLARDAPSEATQMPPAKSWGSTDDDLALARVVWGKLSERARDVFGAMIDEPGEKFSGETLAADLDIPNGKYGVAGVLAWPGRHCAAVGRVLPVQYEEGPKGESASYWMTPEVAALFEQARDNE